jgi:hypothetical protein
MGVEEKKIVLVQQWAGFTPEMSRIIVKQQER